VCSDAGFIDIIVRNMKPLFSSPGDPIVVEGSQGAEMYFLTRGRVEVVHAGSREEGHVRVCDLGAGSYFGEIALVSATIPGVPSSPSPFP
jgi:CRP-like cAMP-binding protein